MQEYLLMQVKRGENCQAAFGNIFVMLKKMMAKVHLKNSLLLFFSRVVLSLDWSSSASPYTGRRWDCDSCWLPISTRQCCGVIRPNHQCLVEFGGQRQSPASWNAASRGVCGCCTCNLWSWCNHKHSTWNHCGDARPANARKCQCAVAVILHRCHFSCILQGLWSPFTGSLCVLKCM